VKGKGGSTFGFQAQKVADVDIYGTKDVQIEFVLDLIACGMCSGRKQRGLGGGYYEYVGRGRGDS